jgi:hypothetical protein
MVSQKEVGASGDSPFLIDSFTSNLNVAASTVSELDPVDYPREANYKYMVMGYSKIVIPIELLVVYVANRMFEALWALWDNGLKRSKSPDELQGLLKTVGLSDAGAVRESIKKLTNYGLLANEQAIKNGASSARARRVKEVVALLNDEFDVRFRQYGPYYLVNLTNDMQGYLKNVVERTARENASTARSNKDKAEYTETANLAREVRESVLTVNNDVYEIYTAVIDAFKVILNDAVGILQDTNRFDSVFGQTYQWTPKEVKLDDQSVVRQHLEKIIGDPRKFAKEKGDKFIQVLLDKREEWTGMKVDATRTKRKFDIQEFNAFEVIQDFLENYFHTMVRDSIEDFLAKCYSGDPDAKATEIVNGAEEPTRQLADAVAKGIVPQIATAHPLILTDTTTLDTFLTTGAGKNDVRYVVLPNSAPHLSQLIANNPEAKIPAANIFTSNIDDGIFCYRAISAIPAFMFNWTLDGEDAYALNLHEIGLHMDEGGRTNWRNLPNLYPEDLWKKNGGTHKFDSERLYSQHIRDIFAEAKDQYGLISSQENELTTTIDYTAHLLKAVPEDTEQYANTLNEKLANINGVIDIHHIVEVLQSQNIEFDDTPLLFSAMSHGFNGPWTNRRDRDQWFREIAEKSLRKMDSEIHRLEDTLAVFRALKPLVEARNGELTGAQTSLEKRPKFIRYYQYGIISTRDFGGDLQWIYTTENGTERPFLDTGRIEPALLRSFHLKKAFEAFLDLDDHVIDELDAVLQEKQDETDNDLEKRKEVNERKQAWKQDIEDFRKAKDESSEIPYPMSSFAFEKKIEKASGDASLAEELREFYDDFIAAI